MFPIKYRVWCKNNNEWEKDEIAIKPNGFIMHMSTKRSFPCMVRADTHIVQFFTGRKDRNGKEVYNGDIVDVDEGMGRFLVKWDEKETGFYLDYKGIDDEAVTLSTVENGEVIGNIFENPELLEVSPK